jgi:hypothetical protein
MAGRRELCLQRRLDLVMRVSAAEDDRDRRH